MTRRRSKWWRWMPRHTPAGILNTTEEMMAVKIGSPPKGSRLVGWLLLGVAGAIVVILILEANARFF